MRLFISYVVMLVPILAVVIWAGGRLKKEGMKFLGLALMASALCTYLGAKFFDLYSIGRWTLGRGETALGSATAVFVVGMLLVLIHYAVMVMKSLMKHEKKG